MGGGPSRGRASAKPQNKPDKNNSQNGGMEKNKNHTNPNLVQRPLPDPVVKEKTQTLFVALFDYKSRGQGDLSFKEGDLFEVLQKHRGWLMARKQTTKQEGFIPSNYVVEYKSIKAEKWFAGTMRRAVAESKLLSSENPQGAYLIRESETRIGEYSLSVKDCETVKHYRIRYARIVDGRGPLYFIARRNPFDSLTELVQHYEVDADGLCTNLTQPCAEIDEPEEVDLSPDMTDKWEIERTSLKFETKLGQGQFGEVYKGLWNETTAVAIKQLKPGTMSAQDFLAEAQCMKKLNHKKLIKLYAVCTKEEPILIITELMANGSLLSYLQGRGRNINMRQMVDIGAQVACGMAYLESQSFIHRDLAARNVLVGRKNIVKVADFGLARVIDEDIYAASTGQRVPVKWTAPEAYLFQKFSNKSDVWSFGILLTEIVTYGRSPYPGMSNAEVMNKVSKGYRMPKPDDCPEKLYDIMLETWRIDPQRRPTFETLQWSLEDFFINEGSEYRENA